MKILFLTLNPSEIYSVEYRCLIYQDILIKNGIEPTYRPIYQDDERETYQALGNRYLEYFDKGRIVLTRLVDILKSRKYDWVILQRCLLPGISPGFDFLLRKFAKRLIFDFDDAIFTLQDHLKPANWETNPTISGEFAKVKIDIKLADVVIAGNSYLANFAGKYNKRVEIIPTPVDTSIFKPLKQKRGSEIVTIGWSGSSSNLYYLKQIEPVLRSLQEKHHVRIKVVCSEKPNLALPDVIWEKWTSENEVKNLNSFDIGIAPLPDDSWTKGKCGLKLLKYMAVGKPTVSSAVGVHNEIIKNGENGYLATNDEEFYKSLEKLINNPDQRDEMGKKARDTVINNYSLEICSKKLLDVLKNS
jgi:glycosyltransferase involved in cell wall biosynthesis